MTNEVTVATDTGKHLDDILGAIPVSEPMQDDELPKAAEKPKKVTKEPELKEPERPEEKTVSYSALHEERERRKELQAKLKEQEERNNRIEERFTKLSEIKTAPAEEEYVDPLAKLERELGEIKQVITKTTTAQADEDKRFQTEQQLVVRYKASLDAAAKDIPDIMDARLFLLEGRMKELHAIGLNPQEIDAQIKAEEKLIVERAYAGERNPGVALYDVAKARGYEKKTETAKPDIEQIDKGLKASKSLSGGNSNSDNDLSSVSAQDLADMTNEEFSAFFAKEAKKAKGKR